MGQAAVVVEVCDLLATSEHDVADAGQMDWVDARDQLECGDWHELYYHEEGADECGGA